jgi:hypothetical protein
MEIGVGWTAAASGRCSPGRLTPPGDDSRGGDAAWWRGRIGPRGRHGCMPVPRLAGARKAGDVSRRYFLAPRRFANVGVAGSSPVLSRCYARRGQLVRTSLVCPVLIEV